MSHKLLILEDEPIVQAHIASNISTAFSNIEIFNAKSYSDVLNICHQEKIDIALLDIRLENQNYSGIDLARYLRRKGDASIVFVTAFADQTTIQETSAIKPDSYIVKPFNDLQIPTTIHQILSQRTKDNIFPVGTSKTLSPMSARERLAFYETTLDKIALVSITDRFGKIIHANQKFCDISGYSLQELLGQDHSMLNSRHHPPSFWENCWKTLLRGEIWTAEVCNRRKDGSFYWVKAYNAPFLNEEGEITSFFSIRFDISSDQARKELIQLRNQQVDFNFNFDFLEHFTAGIIHELVNPATIIKAGIESFRKTFEKVGNIEQAEKANKLVEHCNRQVQYIRSYRDRLVIKRKTHLEKINLSHFIPNYITENSGSFLLNQENFLFECGLNKEHNVSFCTSDLEQIFKNLIQNSVDFFNNNNKKLFIKFEIKEMGESSFLKIYDNGPGISLEIKNHAFLPFVTSKKQVYETGIGLAQVHQLVQANGARVFFDESYHQGTCIVLEFPKVVSLKN